MVFHQSFNELCCVCGVGNMFVSFRLIKCNVCDHIIMNVKLLTLMIIMLLLDIILCASYMFKVDETTV